MESFYDIGNLVTRVRGNRSLEQLSGNPAFGIFRTAARPHDADVELDAEVEDRDCTVLHTFSFQNSIPCLFGKDAQDYVFRMESPQGETLRMYFNGTDRIRLCPCSDVSLLTFALWMAFNLIGCRRHSLSIHSSCIVFRGKGILFLGESGTGKSTQSKLWMQTFGEAELLNDDGPFLAPFEGKYHVFGSPWSGKTPCYRNLHVPVKAIVRVVRAPYNRITPLTTLQEIGALLPSFPPALSKDRALQRCVLDTVSRIIEEIPVYRLECLPDTEAALTTYRTLYSDPCHR